MNESEVAQLNRELKNMMDMTLSQLQELNQKIYTILNRGKILSDVKQIKRTGKFLKTSRHGIEIRRDYLGSEEKVFKCLAYFDLSSQNQKDLLAARNILGMEISEKIGTNAVIKFPWSRS